MKLKQLGNSDLQITPLGIGAWAMGGGGWQFAWGPQDDNNSIGAIHAALDAGMNWIDTAAVYGLGHSEEVVAKALQGRSKRPYVFTKCSLVWNGQGEISHSLKFDSIRREVEASLKRLQIDVIDLYQVHWPDPPQEIEEGWETLAKLKQEGKVRWIGVSNFDAAQIEQVRKIAPVTSLQPPYSIIRPQVEREILPYCAHNQIGVIVYSPMQSGLLTGAMTRKRIANMPEDDFRKRNPHFQEPELTRNLELAKLLRDIAIRNRRKPGEVAIAWTLRRPEVTGAIIGLRSPEQVKGVIGAAEFRLGSEEVARIGSFLQSWQSRLVPQRNAG